MKTPEAEPAEETFKRILKTLWENLYRDTAAKTLYDTQ